jgi:hypothetical protein
MFHAAAMSFQLMAEDDETVYSRAQDLMDDCKVQAKALTPSARARSVVTSLLGLLKGTN